MQHSEPGYDQTRPGKLVKLLTPVSSDKNDEEEGFQLTQDFAREFKNYEKLASSNIVIVSVAGAYRKGKSFLLNFFLRYLRALNNGDTQNWMGSKVQSQMLDDGFHWRSGTERDTTGILIWSEPFFIRRPDGEEVAVLLMDTQGTFDHQSTQQDCTTIFAFSTLLSSLQIFNVLQNIQETDLQHLRLFVEFASMAKNSKEKVLQHLWFLIRDWQNPDEYAYGVDGGEKYLQNVLACDDQKPRENQELRQGITNHFVSSSCCLLPHPGKAVTLKEFKGQVNLLDCEFVEHLDQFVRRILSPESLVVKKVNGKKLTGRELFSLAEVYFEEFRLGKLPTPKSIFTATVEMANLTASADARRFFEETMCSLPGPTTTDEELNSLLQKILDQAIEQFDAKCMERGSRDTKRSREKLESQLQGLFQQQRLLNQLKSERIAAKEKNEILMAEMKRMEDDSREAKIQIGEMQKEFGRKVTEIQQSAVSKAEMESMLHKEQVKHSEEQKVQMEYMLNMMKEKDELKKQVIIKDKKMEQKEQDLRAVNMNNATLRKQLMETQQQSQAQGMKDAEIQQKQNSLLEFRTRQCDSLWRENQKLEQDSKKKAEEIAEEIAERDDTIKRLQQQADEKAKEIAERDDTIKRLQQPAEEPKKPKNKKCSIS